MSVNCTVVLANDDAEAVDGWQKQKDTDGIRIYTRQVKDSPYKEFKGSALVDASLPSALALLDDVAACETWIHRCKEGKTLEEISTTESYERLIYQVTRLPFPFKNRDTVFRARVEWGEHHQSVKILLVSEPEAIEETKLVRVQNSWGSYQVSVVNDQQVRLRWIHYADPKGLLPAFLVNSLSENIPYKSLKNFRERVKHPKYQNLTFQFNDKGDITGFKPVVGQGTRSQNND